MNHHTHTVVFCHCQEIS